MTLTLLALQLMLVALADYASELGRSFPLRARLVSFQMQAVSCVSRFRAPPSRIPPGLGSPLPPKLSRGSLPFAFRSQAWSLVDKSPICRYRRTQRLYCSRNYLKTLQAYVIRVVASGRKQSQWIRIVFSLQLVTQP